MQELKQTIEKLVETIAKLRAPEGGCPWDLEQDFETLRTYMIEEAYEASEAMSEAETDQSSKPKQHALCDELGDVLLQVVLNAQVASERNMFDFKDVAKTLTDKMIRRHPHVFGDKKIENVDELYQQWDSIKDQERRDGKKAANPESDPESKLEKKYRKLKSIAPPSKQATKIGKLTAKIDFDWSNPEQVLAKVEEELAELKAAYASKNQKNTKEELGDVYFTLHQMCRHLDLDPELVSQDANKKFLNRFDSMIDEAGGSIEQFKEKSSEQKEALWAKAKSRES